MNKTEQKIFKKLEEMFATESSGHDINHLVRTYNIAKHLQKEEGGNFEVISISALLHDLHRLIEWKTDKFCPPAKSLDEVKSILEDCGIGVDTQNEILHCIEFHEEYSFTKNGKTVSDKETLILQDADNIDAIGAIGVARAFAFGGSHNIPIWLPEIPVSRNNFDESIHDPSEIHHFYNKLLRLKDNMNTAAGKKMASGRHEFMESYLKEFFDEWEGKK